MPPDPKNSSSNAAIYGRYSSDNQREAAIEDQVRVCRRYAELQGFTVVAVYDDPAISGASTLRPGYQKRLEDARLGGFEMIVLAESLDRLSRTWRMWRRSTSTSPTWASACGPLPRAW